MFEAIKPLGLLLAALPVGPSRRGGDGDSRATLGSLEP
jgi:hypothetical protein